MEDKSLEKDAHNSSESKSKRYAECFYWLGRVLEYRRSNLSIVPRIGTNLCSSSLILRVTSLLTSKGKILLTSIHLCLVYHLAYRRKLSGVSRCAWYRPLLHLHLLICHLFHERVVYCIESTEFFCHLSPFFQRIKCLCFLSSRFPVSNPHALADLSQNLHLYFRQTFSLITI